MRLRLFLLPILSCLTIPAADWHHPLYLGRGGYWQQRVPVTIRNGADAEVAGKPVAVAVGNKRGQVPLVGARVEALRVVNEAGTEMLFAVISAEGSALIKGAVPAGAMLHIPAECPAKGNSLYYVYFDNPAAWGTPDFLTGLATAELNGEFEKGTGVLPAGWGSKSADDTHRNSWVTENPHSGKKCVKTVVDAGADPNWVAVYRPRMTIVAGAKYTITAWARAKDTTGKVGWFLHVGNPTKPMIHAPIQETGEGTYDWRKVTFEFVAPAEATMLTMGSVLYGQGTAWFDDVTITCDTPDQLAATAGEVERCPLRTEAAADKWELPARDWPRRLAIQVANPNPEARRDVLVHGDFREALRGSIAAERLRLMHGGKPVPFCLLNGNVLFPTSVPAQTLRTYWLYVAKDAATAAKTAGQTKLGSDIPSDQVFVPATERTDPRAYASLLGQAANLAKNGSFEQGGEMPTDWPAAAESATLKGVRYGLASPGVFGKRCASLTVPHQERTDWVGWRQSVPVQPTRSYLFAAWIKTEDIQQGNVALHAHQRTPDGKLTSERPHLSAGTPMAGTTDWTLASGVTQMPADGGILQVHLTMKATGTIKHDGVLVAEVLAATVGRLQTRAANAETGLTAWSVNPIVKTFRDDLPPETQAPVRLQLARNEQEALQLVVRSPQAIPNFRYELDVPRDKDGKGLGVLEKGVVGYVPIDHPTSYYRSETPVWHRKYPRGRGNCDGWAGWWPDPILPQQAVSLAAGDCQPLWITFETSKDAPAGEYAGAVRLYAGDRLVKRVPVTVNVWDFVLPEEHSLAAIYDIRFAGKSWSREGKSRQQLREDCLRFMAKRKLSGDRVRAQPKFRRDGDRIIADFTDYDKAMALYFDELKFPRAYTPGFFYVFGWAHLPKRILGEHPYEGVYPYEGADRSVLRPAYKRVYQECLRQYWAHMKEKGWADKLVLYISDEPHFTHEEVRQQMKAACDMIHEVDATIPIYSSTWRHCPEWNGYIDVWGVGSYGCFPVEEMQARKAAGDRIWFTTDGQMCTDTPYCAIERLLPHYCFSYDVEAYEFWGIAWLTYDPYEYGWHRYIAQSSGPGSSFYVRYPNGDGFLIYPGNPVGHDGIVASIRVEAARDGVEDYEYLDLLKSLATKTNDTAALALLEEAKSLAVIPNPGGRYSSRILPDPEAVPKLRQQLAAAILRLGSKAGR
jgi:hypothetical protein